MIPGLKKAQNSNSTFFHTSHWYADVWKNIKFEFGAFFLAWNQACLTKNRPRRAFSGLQILTDYKKKQHNGNKNMFFVQASIINIKVCNICVQKIIFTLFARSRKWLDLKT